MNHGILQGRHKGLVKDLADGPSSNVSGVVFPVDEEATAGCCCGSVLPQLFTGSLFSDFGFQFMGYFVEDGIKLFRGVASVEEVSVEGFGDREEICLVGALIPISVDVAKD